MGDKKQTPPGGHKALYRKYRSKSLKEIVGQEHVTKTLENALKQGKINHAYLFTGPRGTGKTSVARILAHEINNLPYNDESSHLDIIEIDAASNRRIDDIRDLREKVHIAPISAKYKVYIIDEVHMLTNESFNALLKTLEEPPAHVIFILATTEVHKLPATILSRAQRHSFKLIPKDKVIKHLAFIAEQEDLKVDSDALELLAEHGGGSFRDSISLLDQISSSGARITSELVETLLGLAPAALVSDLLTATVDGQSSEILNKLEELSAIGLTPSAIAGQLIRSIRREVTKGNSSAEQLKLMSDLLTVHSAQYPQLRLEATLLNVSPGEAASKPAAPISKQTPPSAETPPTPPKTITLKKESVTVRNDSENNKVKPANEVKKDISPPKNTSKQPSGNGVPDVASQWSLVLQRTKEKNNPLYTVLRLATPEIENDELVLIFNFPFHQKKLEEPKYKALVSEIVTEVTGASLPVKSIVDKKRTRPPESISAAPTDPAHASLISSVQDIMGGGEVVSI